MPADPFLYDLFLHHQIAQTVIGIPGLCTKFIPHLHKAVISVIGETDPIDEKTYGELFFMFCDDIWDMDLTSALQSLMALFAEQLSALSADITACIKSKVTEWMDSQAAFIQALFENICWES